MQRKAKLLAILLAAAMVMVQAPLALAAVFEEEGTLGAAVKAGREVSYEAKATWKASPQLIDEKETNDIIASLFGAIKFAGRYGTDGGLSYSSYGWYMQDQPALVSDTVIAGENIYQDASYLPRPIAIEGPEEFARTIQNAFSLLETMKGIPSGTIATSLQASMAQRRNSLAKIVEALPEVLDTLRPALTAWSESAVVGEAYEGKISSVFNVNAASATVYDITQEELLDLADIFLSGLKESDAYWMGVIDYTNSWMVPTLLMMEDEEIEMPSDEETLSQVKAALEELRTSLSALREEDLGLSVYYAECYDEDGNIVTSMAQAAVTPEEEPADLYLEWLPEGEQIFLRATFGSEMSGFALEIQAPKPERTTMGVSRADENRYWSVALSAMEEGDIVAHILLDCTSKTIALGRAATTEGTLRLLVKEDDTNGETNGVEARWISSTQSEGADVAIGTQVDVNVIINEEAIPLITLDCAVATGDPQGAPFDPASGEMEFFHPGAASEEEISAWAEEEMSVSAMRLVFKILSLLPNDVIGYARIPWQ
ncbi:MAG: hypothetical protein FWF69_06870 [Firmicutes bacterium]|nr:hypothetical protein [Bacillota bacterium]